MRRDPRGTSRDGYALIEVTLALVLIALLATLALPGLVRSTGAAALRTAAVRVSALLREDRNAALRTGQASMLTVEAGGRRVRSATTAGFVELPAGAAGAIDGLDDPTIRFFGDGRSTGGDVLIQSASSQYRVSVNPTTGAIDVASP